MIAKMVRIKSAKDRVDYIYGVNKYRLKSKENKNSKYGRSDYIEQSYPFSNVNENNRYERKKLVEGLEAESKGRKNQLIECILSFAEGELKGDKTKQTLTACRIARKFVTATYPHSRYVIAVQSDGSGGHIHVHILVCNNDYKTGMAIGSKFRGKAFIPIGKKVCEDYQEECEAQGFDDIEYVDPMDHRRSNKTPKQTKRSEYNKEKERYLWADYVKDKVNEFSGYCTTEEDFIKNMSDTGIIVETWNHKNKETGSTEEHYRYKIDFEYFKDKNIEIEFPKRKNAHNKKKPVDCVRDVKIGTDFYRDTIINQLNINLGVEQERLRKEQEERLRKKQETEKQATHKEPEVTDTATHNTTGLNVDTPVMDNPVMDNPVMDNPVMDNPVSMRQDPEQEPVKASSDDWFDDMMKDVLAEDKKQGESYESMRDRLNLSDPVKKSEKDPLYNDKEPEEVQQVAQEEVKTNTETAAPPPVAGATSPEVPESDQTEDNMKVKKLEDITPEGIKKDLQVIKELKSEDQKSEEFTTPEGMRKQLVAWGCAKGYIYGGMELMGIKPYTDDEVQGVYMFLIKNPNLRNRTKKYTSDKATQEFVTEYINKYRGIEDIQDQKEHDRGFVE